MNEPNLTIRYEDGSGLGAIVWRARTDRADVSVMVFVEDLLDDLDAESKSRMIEEVV